MYQYNGTNWQKTHEIPYEDGLSGATNTNLTGDGKYLLVHYYQEGNGIIKTYKLQEPGKYLLHVTDTINLPVYSTIPGHDDYLYSPDGSAIVVLYENEPTSNTVNGCLLYTSPSPRDATLSRMPSSA